MRAFLMALLRPCYGPMTMVWVAGFLGFLSADGWRLVWLVPFVLSGLLVMALEGALYRALGGE